MAENISDSNTPTGSLGEAAGGTDGNLRPRSRWWWLWAALSGITGILLYFALRYDDRRRARQCLWIGLISLAVVYGPLLVVFPLAALFSQQSY